MASSWPAKFWNAQTPTRQYLLEGQGWQFDAVGLQPLVQGDMGFGQQNYAPVCAG
ncbi:MAG: hypothetical protein GY846_22275 [Deltaproteobacteria bacterium]|nr:hypothetical protein [Deltaproteobacteria bacterium]